MRTYWFVGLVGLSCLIGWGWHAARQGAAPHSRAAAPAANSRGAQALPAAAPDSHHAGASAAVRAPRHAQTGGPSAHAAPATARAETQRDDSSSAAGSAAPARDESAPPAPAGELFVPFIADDPGQVFAPATVQYHAALQGETQDPAWGPATESALRGYFAQFGDRFEIPYVDCRQDLCELQVASRIGGDLERDRRDAQDAMARIKQEPWWSTLEIDQESGTLTSSADGRVLLLWFFSRK